MQSITTSCLGVPYKKHDVIIHLCTLQVMVELRVVFLKIGEIDTLKEQYSADTFIQAKWREPALDSKSIEVSCGSNGENQHWTASP